MEITETIARKPMKAYERLGHAKNRRRSPELNAWTNILGRCTNQNRPDYVFYGGRGITVCDRWRDSFAAFFDGYGAAARRHVD